MTWRPDYVSATEVATYLRVGDTADNALYATWATAASRAIDRRCNRQFGSTSGSVARVYRRAPYYDPASGLFVLEIDDLHDASGLLVNGVGYAAQGAVLLPDNAAADGLPWERIGLISWPVPSTPGAPIINTVTATGWGWATVPPQVTAASYLQCARWNFRRDAPAGIAGSPDQGSELRLLNKLDPDVSTTLMGLSRRRRVG